MSPSNPSVMNRIWNGVLRAEKKLRMVGLDYQIEIQNRYFGYVNCSTNTQIVLHLQQIVALITPSLIETSPFSPQNPIWFSMKPFVFAAGVFLEADGICTQSKFVFLPSSPYPQQVLIIPMATIPETAKSAASAVVQQILQFPRSFLKEREEIHLNIFKWF